MGCDVHPVRFKYLHPMEPARQMRKSTRYRSLAVVFIILASVQMLMLFQHNVSAAPTVYINFPRQQGAYNSTTIEANWTVEDENGNLTCEYRVDQGSYISVGNRTNVTLNGLLEGFHDLDVRCTNGLGQDTEVGISFWIDTVTPDVQFTHGGKFYTNLDPVMVEWEATDKGAGLDHIETRLDGGPWNDKGNVNRQIITLGSDGTHLFEVMALDKAGNQIVAGKELILDTVKPELELIDPVDGTILNLSTLNISWTGNDSGSGISYFELQVDSVTPYTYQEPSSVKFTNLLDGRHELRITAFDLAGNLKTITATVEIDTRVPYVVQNHPGDWEVRIDHPIWVTTSEMLLPETVVMNVTGATGVMNVSGGQITFFPDRPLEYGTTYFVTLEGEDRAGNKLGPFVWNFTTTDVGHIVGVVVDPFGNVISGSKLNLQKLVNDRSNIDGEFNISHHEGTYWLNITRSGYLDNNITVTIIAGNTTSLGWITLEPIPVRTSKDDSNRIIILMVSILVVVFLIFLMVAAFVFRRHQTHGISHEDREQMLDILRHFDVSTKIHEIDCYEILDVKKTATSKEIKRTYRKLAAKYHPDRMMHKEDFDEDAAHDKMKQINAAKNILMDEEKRDLHDRILKITHRY